MSDAKNFSNNSPYPVEEWVWPKGGMSNFDVPSLWTLTEHNEVQHRTIASLQRPEWNYERPYFFVDGRKTHFERVMEMKDSHPSHAATYERIMASDPSYAIILSPDGDVCDGMHRLAKLKLQGKTQVQAVRATAEQMNKAWVQRQRSGDIRKSRSDSAFSPRVGGSGAAAQQPPQDEGRWWRRQRTPAAATAAKAKGGALSTHTSPPFTSKKSYASKSLTGGSAAAPSSSSSLASNSAGSMYRPPAAKRNLFNSLASANSAPNFRSGHRRSRSSTSDGLLSPPFPPSASPGSSPRSSSPALPSLSLSSSQRKNAWMTSPRSHDGVRSDHSKRRKQRAHVRTRSSTFDATTSNNCSHAVASPAVQSGTPSSASDEKQASSPKSDAVVGATSALATLSLTAYSTWGDTPPSSASEQSPRRAEQSNSHEPSSSGAVTSEIQAESQFAESAPSESQEDVDASESTEQSPSNAIHEPIELDAATPAPAVEAKTPDSPEKKSSGGGGVSGILAAAGPFVSGAAALAGLSLSSAMWSTGLSPTADSREADGEDIGDDYALDDQSYDAYDQPADGGQIGQFGGDESFPNVEAPGSWGDSHNSRQNAQQLHSTGDSWNQVNQEPVESDRPVENWKSPAQEYKQSRDTRKNEGYSADIFSSAHKPIVSTSSHESGWSSSGARQPADQDSGWSSSGARQQPDKESGWSSSGSSHRQAEQRSDWSSASSRRKPSRPVGGASEPNRPASRPILQRPPDVSGWQPKARSRRNSRSSSNLSQDGDAPARQRDAPETPEKERPRRKRVSASPLLFKQALSVIQKSRTDGRKSGDSRSPAPAPYPTTEADSSEGTDVLPPKVALPQPANQAEQSEPEAPVVTGGGGDPTRWGRSSAATSRFGGLSPTYTGRKPYQAPKATREPEDFNPHISARNRASGAPNSRRGSQRKPARPRKAKHEEVIDWNPHITKRLAQNKADRPSSAPSSRPAAVNTDAKGWNNSSEPNSARPARDGDGWSRGGDNERQDGWSRGSDGGSRPDAAPESDRQDGASAQWSQNDVRRDQHKSVADHGPRGDASGQPQEHGRNDGGWNNHSGELNSTSRGTNDGWGPSSNSNRDEPNRDSNWGRNDQAPQNDSADGGWGRQSESRPPNNGGGAWGRNANADSGGGWGPSGADNGGCWGRSDRAPRNNDNGGGWGPSDRAPRNNDNSGGWGPSGADNGGGWGRDDNGGGWGRDHHGGGNGGGWGRDNNGGGGGWGRDDNTGGGGWGRDDNTGGGGWGGGGDRRRRGGGGSRAHPLAR